MPDFDMSPYGAFVWPAWAISVAVLAALVARALIASRRWTTTLKALEDAQAASAEPSAGAETSPRAQVVAPTRAQVARSAIAPKK